MAGLRGPSRRFSWRPTNISWLWKFCRGGRAGDALEGHREGPGPHPMGNGRMSAGKIDAPATLGMEDGHHHGGETP